MNKKLIARGVGVEVWLTDKPEYIVLATPFETDNEEDHNCDQMGCGSCHVIWRSEVSTDAELNGPWDQGEDKIIRPVGMDVRYLLQEREII